MYSLLDKVGAALHAFFMINFSFTHAYSPRPNAPLAIIVLQILAFIVAKVACLYLVDRSAGLSHQVPNYRMAILHPAFAECLFFADCDTRQTGFAECLRFCTRQTPRHSSYWFVPVVHVVAAPLSFNQPRTSEAGTELF